MADFRARQRVQIHDGTDEFGVLSTKPIFVNVGDGTNQLNLDGSGSLTVVATDLDIRNLSETTDHVLVFANTAKDGSGTDYVPLVDTDGHLQVDILSGSGGTEYSEDDATPATIVGGAIMIERDDALATLTPIEGDWVSLRSNERGALWVELDLTNDVTIADGGNSITVDALDLDIRDLTSASDSVEVLQATHDNLNANANIQVGDADVSASNPVPVSATSAANSETNPIYVQNVTTGTSASEVHNYKEDVDVAKDGTGTHDYLVTGTTFLLKSVIVASSGAMRVEIKTGPSASLVTKAMIFTSPSKPMEQIVFNPPIEVPVTSTGTVSIIKRNDDNSTMSLYSTIIGSDV